MKFRGSQCSKDCGGHKAGFRYAKSGKRKPSPHSPSFNKGLKMGAKAVTKKRKKRKKK